MQQRGLWVVVLLVMALLSGQPTLAQSGPQTNLTEGCVEAFDSAVDYFPDKVDVLYAEGFTVEYLNHYKVVTVPMPWPGAGEDDSLQYVLVQCGAPVPEDLPGDVQVFEVPSGRLLSMSTTFLPALVELDLLDHLAGVDSLSFINTPEVLALAEEEDRLVEVGSASAVNVELVLDADPALVLANGTGSADFDAHPVLLAAGVPVVLSADYTETSPLGQAEWVKFIALFYNREALATEYFDGVAEEYSALAELTIDLMPTERPLVLWNSYSSWGEAWFIPGSNSYVAQLLADAGALMVLGDDETVAGLTGGVPFDFEVVYDAGLEADFWFPGEFMWYSLEDVLAADARYADFAAYQNGDIYNNNAHENASGFNDYFENGPARPQRVLADLIAILHPDLLPDHELVFFRPLAAGE